MLCEQCGGIPDHAEHFGARVRAWCEQHTPWSGHYENCGHVCRALILPTAPGGESAKCVDAGTGTRAAGRVSFGAFRCNCIRLARKKLAAQRRPRRKGAAR